MNQPIRGEDFVPNGILLLPCPKHGLNPIATFDGKTVSFECVQQDFGAYGEGVVKAIKNWNRTIREWRLQ